MGLFSNLSSGAGSAIAGGATAAGGLIGGIISNRTNKKLARERNALEDSWFQQSQEFERKMWEDTNTWNLEQWNRQNEYDSPSAQAERLKVAGINPLMVGTNAVAQSDAVQSASGSAVSPPNAEMAQVSNPMQGVDFGAYLDTMLKAKGVEGAELDNEFKRLQNQWQPTIFQDEHDIREATRAQIEADTKGKNELAKNYVIERRLTKERIKYQRSLRKQVEKSTSWMDKVNQAQLDELANKISLLAAQEVTERERAKTEKANQSAAYASAEESRASAALSREQAEGQRITNESLDERNRAEIAQTEQQTLNSKLDNLLKTYDIDHGVRKRIIKYMDANPDKLQDFQFTKDLLDCLEDCRDPRTKAYRRSYGPAILNAVSNITGIAVGALMAKSAPAAGAAVAAGAAGDPAMQGVPFN